MDTAKLNDWLTVVTNIGVIAGLVLLAYEISQTNESLEQDATALGASYVANTNEMWGRFVVPLYENPDVAALWIRGGADESLSAIETERYRHLTDMLFWITLLQLANERLRDPNFDAEGSGPVVVLKSYMTGRPGLRARFDEWAELFPRQGAILSRFLEQPSAQG